MGMDFNLAESEWAKEDDKELNKLLTKEEIKIEILEKQIGILKQENEQLRKNLAENESDCEMCNFPKLKTDLEKENAELKERLKEHESIGNAQFWENVWSWKSKSEQLTKAKDHIKKLLDCLEQDTNDPQTNYYVCQYMDKAEQFLNSEVEK